MGEWRRSGWLVLALVGCGGAEAPNDETACDPGVVIECPCPGGQAGAQRCRDDGAGYEECQCPGATASSGVTTGVTTAQGSGGATSASSGVTTASVGGGGSGGEGTGAGGAASGSTVSAGGGGSGGVGGAGGNGGATSSTSVTSSSATTTSASTSTSATTSVSVGTASATTTSGSGGAGGDGTGGAGGAGAGGAGGGNGVDRPPFSVMMAGEQHVYLTDLEVAGDGSIYVLLWSSGPGSFQGFTLGGACLLKLDPDGNLAWGHQLPNVASNGGIVLDENGDVVLAATFFDILDLGGDIEIGDTGDEVAVARWDRDGVLIASNGFLVAGNNASHTQDVAIAASGAVVVTGEYLGTMNVDGIPLTWGGGQRDTFLIALEPDLSPIWARTAANLRFGSLAATADGDIVAAGFGYGAMSVMGFSASGGGNGSSDLALLRFDLTPTGEWFRTYGGAATDENVLKVANRADGGLLLHGYLAGGGRANFGLGELLAPAAEAGFLVGMTADADPIFSRQFGGVSSTYVTHARSTADSGAVVVGQFENTLDVGGEQLVSQGSIDAWLSTIGPSGAVLEPRRHGGALVDLLYRVAPEPGETLVVGGMTNGTMDLGLGPHTSPSGATAIVIARIPAP